MSTNAMRVHMIELMYTMDDYQWLRTMPAAEAPVDAKSWAEALPPWWFRLRTMPRYEPWVWYWMAHWMPDKFGSGDKEESRSETQEGRKWVNRVSKLGTGGKVINWVVFSSVSSLLFSSPYFITSLDLGPVQMASARVFTTSRVRQVQVDFPPAPHPPKSCPEWYQLVAGLMILYECVRCMIV